MYRPIDNLENGMVLFDEHGYGRDKEDDYSYEDYLADEADRQWKIEQEEGLRNDR